MVLHSVYFEFKLSRHLEVTAILEKHAASVPPAECCAIQEQLLTIRLSELCKGMTFWYLG